MSYWFQELLHECRDIQEHKKKLEEDKAILKFLKQILEDIKIKKGV